MSKHAHMPPRLDCPWNFGTWDNLKTSTPPWEHRGFWYHGETGDTLVIVWRYGFDDADQLSVCGHIYRCEDNLSAILLWKSLHNDVDRGSDGLGYDGVFIFYGTRRMSEEAVYGEPFPEPLPDRRWL